MKALTSCPNCHSTSFFSWSTFAAEDALHQRQSKCRSCGLVFSNPQRSRQELEDYYSTVYYDSRLAEMFSDDSMALTRAADTYATEIDLIMRFAPGGRVLEIGAGTGTFLNAMKRRGFETAGVEPSARATAYAASTYGSLNIENKAFEDAQYPENHFDVVYAWHVIEHILDLDAFVREAWRITRPGGILWIGTENYLNSTYLLERALRVMRGASAPFATSTEHTFAFTVSTLKDVLERRGFEVLVAESYQPPLKTKLQPMRFKSFLSRLYFIGHHAANLAFRTGPLIRVVARRP